MATTLLAERGQSPVGKCWARRFINRSPEVKTCWTRGYDRQRALSEDPEAIKAWFRLVANIKTKYGIQDKDVWNFDETGFMMGVITTRLVITGSERRGRRKYVQPGNREWATVIQGIGQELVASRILKHYPFYTRKNASTTRLLARYRSSRGR